MSRRVAAGRTGQPESMLRTRDDVGYITSSYSRPCRPEHIEPINSSARSPYQPMFTAQQYRAKAAEYDGFLAAAQSPAEIAEYRGLKQSYALHADNLDWLAANAGKTMSTEVRDPPRRKRRDRNEAYAEQENILRCLGAAVMLNWNTMPARLQRPLFESA